MTRLPVVILAGSIALTVTMSATGCTADPPTSQKSQNPSTQNPQAAPSDNPASEASDKSNRPEEQNAGGTYQANIRKCETISDTVQRQQCFDMVRKAHGHM